MHTRLRSNLQLIVPSTMNKRHHISLEIRSSEHNWSSRRERIGKGIKGTGQPTVLFQRLPLQSVWAGLRRTLPVVVVGLKSGNEIRRTAIVFKPFSLLAPLYANSLILFEYF